MTPNEYFDMIYCINLDRRPDRWDRIRRRFERMNISVTRISAIDGKGINVRSGIDALRDTNIIIFNDAIEKGYERIWIIEDDALFHKDFLYHFSQHADRMPKDFDIWWLGAIIPESFKLEPQYLNYDYFIKGDYIYATHSMAYNKKFFSRFIETFKDKPFVPIDCILSESIIANKWASVKPMLCVQEHDKSDIIASVQNEETRMYDSTIYDDYTGVWTDTQKATEHKTSERLAKLISEIIDKREPVYDLGCGNGYYVDYLIGKGFDCIGFDGNPLAEYNEKIIRMDLARPFIKDTYKNGTVICLEVGEHIPKEYEDVFIENVVNRAKNKIIISWANPNQGGCGHVNEQSNYYIINKFRQMGYVLNFMDTNYLRDNMVDDELWWFKNTLMVFDRGNDV